MEPCLPSTSQKRPTKETHKRDLQKRPTQETYKRDLRKKLVPCLPTNQGGDQTYNIWVSRFAGVPGHSFEWRGLPFTHMKNCLKLLGLPWKRVWKLEGFLWKLVEIVAVGIILSLISSICGITHKCDGWWVSSCDGWMWHFMSLFCGSLL